MRFSASLTSANHKILCDHLIRMDGQEDVCYALWSPASGAQRYSAQLTAVLLPRNGERMVHGNASTTSAYLGRAINEARSAGCGVAFLHSHPSPGWQDMSHDDVETEMKQMRAVKAATGLPLLGMTMGNDGSWSARVWSKTGPKKYERRWCESVRVIGERGLEITFHDGLLPPPEFREELKRTISAWGEQTQLKLARTRIGVVGVGSVGSLVAEALARIGIQHIKLIDYDRVARHNLDRLLHAGRRDASRKRLKVDVIGRAISRSATAENPIIERLSLAVTEQAGFQEALDCDLIFSCVDRPWGRHVLNYIAYSYLIPVIDGGILIRRRNGRLRQASWRSHAVYPGKRCLQCIGQYDPSYVNVERRGDLDDPTYIEGLPAEHPLRRNENVFPFSLDLASCHIIQTLHILIHPVGISDLGEEIHHFVDGSTDTTRNAKCEPNCFFAGVVGRGDHAALPITGVDLTAQRVRRELSPRLVVRFLDWISGS